MGAVALVLLLVWFFAQAAVVLRRAPAIREPRMDRLDRGCLTVFIVSIVLAILWSIMFPAVQ